MNKDARKIADAVLATDTDLRGLLFAEVADILRKKSQHYTAVCFDGAAEIYDGGIRHAKENKK